MKVQALQACLCIVCSWTTEAAARMKQLDVALSSCWISIAASCVPPEVPRTVVLPAVFSHCAFSVF